MSTRKEISRTNNSTTYQSEEAIEFIGTKTEGQKRVTTYVVKIPVEYTDQCTGACAIQAYVSATFKVSTPNGYHGDDAVEDIRRALTIMENEVIPDNIPDYVRGKITLDTDKVITDGYK